MLSEPNKDSIQYDIFSAVHEEMCLDGPDTFIKQSEDSCKFPDMTSHDILIQDISKTGQDFQGFDISQSEQELSPGIQNVYNHTEDIDFYSDIGLDSYALGEQQVDQGSFLAMLESIALPHESVNLYDADLETKVISKEFNIGEMELEETLLIDKDLVDTTVIEEQLEEVNISTTYVQSPDSTTTVTTPPTNSPLLPPCRVCGEKASGFHYGANTCEACKGFFRRSIVKVQNNKEEYKCLGSGDCSIKPGKRSACPYCRYKKCLEVGMSQDAIKTGRYTYEKRTRDTQEVKKLQKKDSPPPEILEISDEEAKRIVEAMVDVQDRLCPLRLTSEQKVEFIRQRQQDIYEQYKTKQEIFGHMSAIPLDVYNEFYSLTGMELDDRGEVMKNMAAQMEKGLQNMVDLVRVIPGFTELSVEDQTNLIKVSHFEFWFVYHQMFINPELEVIGGCFAGHKDDILKVYGAPEHVEEVFHYAKTFQALGLLEAEIAILRGVVVTFRDRCELQNPEKVETIQWKLINCLRWIAKINGFNPDERLRRVLDRLTALRTLTESSYKMNKIKASWPVMQKYPLLLDLLSNTNS